MRRILQWAESPLSLTHLFGGLTKRTMFMLFGSPRVIFILGIFLPCLRLIFLGVNKK